MAEEKKSNKVIETIGDIVTVIILVFSVVFTALTLTSLIPSERVRFLCFIRFRECPEAFERIR